MTVCENSEDVTWKLSVMSEQWVHLLVGNINPNCKHVKWFFYAVTK
jgi:hypothetical protein